MTSADLEPAPKRPSDEKDRDFTHADQAEMGSVESPKLQQQGQPESDDVDEKKVIRKIDWRLIPLLTLLYTLTFLDRVNIGNARLWHLERDLHMKGYDYNIAILVFYIPYILFEIPSNMILSRVQPRYYIAGLTLGWGLTVTFSGFCTSFGGLVTARVFIGVFEAGMFPGCLFLIGSWYRRHEVLSRMAWFMVSNDIAGTISGLLGAGLGALDGAAGYSGWRWIFFVEGALTCATAVLAFFFIPPFPHRSTFLRPEEKAWLLRRLEHDNQVNNTGHEPMTARGALRSLRDWKVLIGGVFYLAVCVTAYSLSVFTPTILNTFGWSSLKSNLLSAPIRIASGIVSVTVGIISDRTRRRAPYALAGYLVSIMGLVITMTVHDGNIRYMGLYFAAIGIYICQPLVIAWSTNQVVGNVKRGTTTAFAVSCGQVGGIISAVIFPKSDGPQYVPGISACIAFQGTGIIATCCMWFFCRRENRKRDKGQRDHLRDLPEDELSRLGEKHPDFRFTL